MNICPPLYDIHMLLRKVLIVNKVSLANHHYYVVSSILVRYSIQNLTLNNSARIVMS